MKTNKNITLSIEDLVLLKQYPNEYLKKELNNLTIKTHDGTSSGPINTHIKDFIHNNVNSAFRCVSIFNEKGEVVKHETEGLEDEDKNETPVYTKEDLNEMGTNNHIIYKPTAMAEEAYTWSWLQDFGHEFFEVPNQTDLERLTYTNEDGEPLVRSITMIPGTGGKNSVTIIKDNNYSSEDNEALMNAGKNLENAVSDFEKIRYDTARQYESDWYNSLPGYNGDTFIDEEGIRRNPIAHPDYSNMKANKDAYVESQVGNIYDYLEESGVYNDFENAHTKLKVRKNDNVELKHEEQPNHIPYNQEDYEDTWAEWYDEPFYSEPTEPPSW